MTAELSVIIVNEWIYGMFYALAGSYSHWIVCIVYLKGY